MKFDEKVRQETLRTGSGPVEVCKQVLISKLNQINEYNLDNEESRMIDFLIMLIEEDDLW